MLSLSGTEGREYMWLPPQGRRFSFPIERILFKKVWSIPAFFSCTLQQKLLISKAQYRMVHLFGEKMLMNGSTKRGWHISR